MKSTSEKLTTAGWWMIGITFALYFLSGRQTSVFQGFLVIGGMFTLWLSCIFHEWECEAAAEQREELAKAEAESD